MTEETITSLFWRQVEALGDRVALREKVHGLWKDICWSVYGRNVREAACGLIELGQAKGECVSVIGENRLEWLSRVWRE